MGLFFGRKKKKEIDDLEIKEESETCKELEDIDAILLKFNILTRNRGTFNDHKEKYMEFLNQLEDKLHDMKVHNDRLTKIAQKLEDDLVSLRKKAQDENLLKMTKREKEVLQFGKNLTRHIDQTAKIVKDFKTRDFKKDEEYAEEYASLSRNIYGLKKLLEELFDLERNVGKLTREFLADAETADDSKKGKKENHEPDEEEQTEDSEEEPKEEKKEEDSEEETPEEKPEGDADESSGEDNEESSEEEKPQGDSEEQSDEEPAEENAEESAEEEKKE